MKKNVFQQEVHEYSIALEEVLQQYTGLSLKFIEDDLHQKEGEIDLNISLYKPGNFPPYVKDFFGNVIDKVLDVLPERIKVKEDFDWEILSNIQELLSIQFIFGSNKDEKVSFKRKQFLNSLINVGHRTYEGSPANIGIIYADAQTIEILQEMYKFELIKFTEKVNLRDLFEQEKPLLKIVDGKAVNILVDKDFSIYGFARSNNESMDMAYLIEQDFIKIKLKQVIGLMAKRLLDEYSKELKKFDYSDDTDKKEIISSFISLVEELDEKPNYNQEPLNMIYFKMKNSTLRIYNTELFEVSAVNGRWKIKNDYILYYILIWHFVKNTQIEFLSKENDEKILESVMILINSIQNLSVNNISSLIIFTPNMNDKSTDYSINTEQANQLLESLPLKQKEIKHKYLEIIKSNEKHLNIKEINYQLLINICSVDGAVIFDPAFNILSYGEIIDIPSNPTEVFGTGTNACKIASENGGLAIKVSEDGDIKVYSNGEMILTL